MPSDGIASNFTDTTGGGYLVRVVPAGSYQLGFLPGDTSFKPATATATVTLGSVTVVDTVRLQK
ncbi:MAG TPA: hypothetical protein VG870_11340 [Chitinophagaceae bacterium]|nr:hypothetical protein [Chitinophagaceae bacterium]